MCAISGVFFKKPPDAYTLVFMRNLYNRIQEDSRERGRDSVGMAMLDSNLGVVSMKSVVPKVLDIPFSSSTIAVIQNYRAEPTTEFVENKSLDDVQPYSYDGYYVVHNGTIANDHEFTDGLELPTKVDSQAIPVALSQGRFNELVGSQATAYFYEKDGDLTLYRNYQPLSVFWLPRHNAYVFVSLDEYFTDNVLKQDYVKLDFPPYSSIVLSRNPMMSEVTSRRLPTNGHKAIVVCSGGLDSTVAATIACEECNEITIAHFLYGCQAESQETKAVTKVTQSLQAKFPNKKITLKMFPLDYIKELGGSPLTTGGEIAHGEAGAEFAHEWVPARNTVMIALIAAYCDRYDIGRIYLGLNLEEAGAYEDNNVVYYRFFNDVLDVGTKSRPRIYNPLDCLMKHEIVKLALKIGAPIEHSWSCYKGGEIHCGDCGPCYLRSKAFKMNGIKDMIPYKSLPSNWWENCK
jgi:7-cyano-7-deazaguanine synthase